MIRKTIGTWSLLLAFLAGFPGQAEAGDWDISASVDLQSRLFTETARWPGQASRSAQFSMAATADLRWRNDAGNQRMSAIPYARWDHTDSERSLLDLREAYWAWEGNNVELLIGANTVFWGVAESVHLVDIVNQTDLNADIDGEDKLGQPMLNLALQQDWGELSFYVLPYFRERTFAGSEGRFRTPLTVQEDAARFESSADEHNIDLALRYSHYIGDVDIGLSMFSGTSREARLVASGDGTALVPHYDLIDQLGVDLQYTRDAWLWKLEAIWRDGFEDSFAAAVAGFEYTVYQVRESAADVGLLFEYQYDGRDAGEPVTIADNDVFVGSRLAFNDTQDTAVLAGIGYDIDTGETFLNIEGERRVGQDYFLEVRARAFTGASIADPSYVFASDDYVQLQLSRYF